MYKFYCDDTLFYLSGVDDSDYFILNSKITLEKGKVGALSFTLPPSNIVYDRIQKLKSIITVYDNDEEIFRGRVLYDEKDFYNRREIACEGELAFLLDSIMRPFEFKGSITELFTKLITNHNDQVEEAKRFEIGNITVKDTNDYINRSSSDYENTYNTITKKLIETHGGYLKTRVSDGKRIIDYVEEYGEVNNQTIEFGVNLLDIKEYITAENIFTCLIPLGAKDEKTGKRLTIESVNGGFDYLTNETAIKVFGKIFAVNTWDDVTVASNLKTKGQAWLDSNIEMSVTLTLKAVDLHILNINTKRIKEGDKLRVISLPHNLDKYFECSKVVIDTQNPDQNEYTFGSTYKTLTDPITNLENKVVTYVDEVITQVEETTKQEIANVKDNLTQEEIMNIITNNGEVEGVYLIDGQIWIKGTYIEADTLSAICANLGHITGGSLNIGNGKFIVTEAGRLTAIDAKFTGEIIGSSFYSSTLTNEFTYTAADVEIMEDLSFSETLTDEQLLRYDINKNGKIESEDIHVVNAVLLGAYGNEAGKVVFEDYIAINLQGSHSVEIGRKINDVIIYRTTTNSGGFTVNGDR